METRGPGFHQANSHCRQVWNGAKDSEERPSPFWHPGAHGLLSRVDRQRKGRVRRIDRHHLGPHPVPGESAPALIEILNKNGYDVSDIQDRE